LFGRVVGSLVGQLVHVQKQQAAGEERWQQGPSMTCPDELPLLCGLWYVMQGQLAAGEAGQLHAFHNSRLSSRLSLVPALLYIRLVMCMQEQLAAGEAGQLLAVMAALARPVRLTRGKQIEAGWAADEALMELQEERDLLAAYRQAAAKVGVS
jgi:hypothetical protein